MSTFYISVLFVVFITRMFYFHNQNRNQLEGKLGELQPNCRNPALTSTPQPPTFTTTYEGATFLHKAKHGSILQYLPLPLEECKRIRAMLVNEEKLPQSLPGFSDITESLLPSFSWAFFAFFLTGSSFSRGLFLLLSMSAAYVRKRPVISNLKTWMYAK